MISPGSTAVFSNFGGGDWNCVTNISEVGRYFQPGG